MDNYKKNLHYPFIFFLVHSILYLISYAIGITNFYIILSSQYKSFFISSYIILGLSLIFMIKLIFLFKSSIDSIDNIKCSLIIYVIMSIISLVFIVVEYFLIFKNINDSKCILEKKYKIAYICISLFYHAYNNLIFIYECYIVIKAVHQNISERIQLQILEQRNNNNNNDYNNDKNKTQSSEKSKKDESFIKEETIVIVQGNFKEEIENNNENIVKIKKNSNLQNSSNTSRILKNENNDEDNKIYSIKKEKNMNNNRDINSKRLIINKPPPNNKKPNLRINSDNEEV